MNLASLIQDSLDWLEQAALEQGGWGIISVAPYRSYSTALAIQPLCRYGRRTSQTVQRSIHYLISIADPGTGDWHDVSRNLSVPTTREVVRALCAAASEHSRYYAELSRACDWLLSIGRQTSLWAAGTATACIEEVEVEIEAKRIRIEFGHSPRPVAIIALSEAGQAGTPEIIAAVRMLLDDIAAKRWELTSGARYSELTSWGLYDISTALIRFRNAFSRRTVSVWADNVRVVENLQGQGFLTRIVKEHKAKLVIAGICVLFVWMLVRFGIVESSVPTMGLFIALPIALNLISNFIFEFMRDRHQKRSYSGRDRTIGE